MHNETFFTNKNIKEITIALLSDIHYYFPGFNLKLFFKIIKQLKENKPNYLCICGDILDSSSCTQLQELKNFLNEAARICPIIVILGNHDEKKGNILGWNQHKNKELIHLLKTTDNLHFLQDETFIKDNICFYGFHFSFNHYNTNKESYTSFIKEANQLKTKLTKNHYNIVLFHSPKKIYQFIKEHPQHELAKCDLILSGHMHNGLLPFWCTKLLNKTLHTHKSLISPEKTLFPSYAQGRINDGKEGFVYEGLSKLSKSTGFFHIFNNLYQPNLQFITIKKEQEKLK